MIEGNIKSLKSIFDSIIRQLTADAEKYRNYRTSTVAVAGTIIIPILLAIASQAIIIVPEQVKELDLICMIVAIIAGILALVFTVLSMRVASNRSRFNKEFSRLGYVFEFEMNAYRGETTGALITTQEDLVKNYYDFFHILHTAIMYKLLRLAESHLDENAKILFKAQIDFMCQVASWNVLTSSRGENLVKANKYVSELLGEYKTYCKK